MSFPREGKMKRTILGICFLLWPLIFWTGAVQASKASPFKLSGLDGKTYDLSVMKKKMLVLYFFDAGSRSSQEGLFTLDQLQRKYGRKTDLAVWAITTSPISQVKALQQKSGVSLPILLDDGTVSARFGARVILPTTVILGPKLQILDTIQGGGKVLEVTLVRIAQRELQRRRTIVAEKISEEVAHKDPNNVEAQAVKGYALLKRGQTEEAENVFRKLASQGGKAEVIGKEGLAAVYVRKGRYHEALTLTEEVEKKDPERAYVHVLRGDILYAQGKKEAARREYEKGVQKKEAEPYQQGERFNKLGRYYASTGKYDQALSLYDKAIEVDPFYIEGMSNKGMIYEKKGDWTKALEAYRQALAIDRNDTFAAVLAKRAQEMLKLQRDTARRERIDRLVKELAQRFREQKKLPPPEDTWTSRPMVISFLSFQEKGGLSKRDGFSLVFTTQLADYLKSSGRVKVVERILLEELLQELNLGSSELADPETALKLGRVLAAKLIAVGTFYYLPGGTLINMRLIDTETSDIPLIVNKQLPPGASLDKTLFELNRKILDTVISKYPLRGYIVEASKDRVMLNIGARQGVVAGTRFEVIEKGGVIFYKGRKLRKSATRIGLLEVVSVEPDLSYARVIEASRPLKTDDMVREIKEVKNVI